MGPPLHEFTVGFGGTFDLGFFDGAADAAVFGRGEVFLFVELLLALGEDELLLAVLASYGLIRHWISYL